MNTEKFSKEQQIQWQAIEAYINSFSVQRQAFRDLILKQARDWFEREFVACDSGAVAKRVRDFGEPLCNEWLEKAVCGDCGEPLTLVRPGKHQCDNELCKSNRAWILPEGFCERWPATHDREGFSGWPPCLRVAAQRKNLPLMDTGL